MTKLASLLHLGLALALLLPIYAARPQAADELRTKLASTVAALDELARIEPRLAHRDASALEDLRACTEPPLDCGAVASARDELLAALRADVAALEAALEPPVAAEVAAPVDPRPTAGLDPGLVRELTAPASPRAEGAPDAPSREPQAFEAEGYVADPLRLGQAALRAGRAAQALDVLARAGDSPEASYDRARCLERLGRAAEALAEYERVAAAPDGGCWAQRAAEDREFLAWKLALERAVAARRNAR